MKLQTIQFEAKKDGLRQTQETVKLTLSIHPSDISPALYTAAMGQAFMVVLAPIDGGEPVKIEPPAKPEKDAKKWKEMSCAQKAGIRCGDADFQEFIRYEHSGSISATGDDPAKQTASAIRDICKVSTRADIAKSPDAMKAFDNLDEQFHLWLKYEKDRK